MKKRNILILSSLNPWDDIRIYKKEANSLSKRFNVTYICAGTNDEKKEINKIKVIVLKKPNGFIERLKHLKKILKLIKEVEADVFHLHNPELLILVPFIKRKYPKSKIIFDMHEDFEEAIKDKQWIPNTLRITVSKLYRFYLNRLLKSRLDYTIVTTPLIKDRFNSVNNIEVIENFAPLIGELPTKKMVPQNIQNCIDENNDKIKIVFTGLINKQRGIFEVIDAVKRTQNTIFIMIGLYSEDFYGELQKKIRQQKLEKRIYLFESVEYNQMLASMIQMDIGILPYLPYGNHVVTRPNKLFEYMMASLPVISSNFPLYEEIVKQGVGVSVDPTDVVEIQNAIEKISASPEKRKSMGETGFTLYKSKYNWNLEEEKLFKIYDELLGELK